MLLFFSAIRAIFCMRKAIFKSKKYLADVSRMKNKYINLVSCSFLHHIAKNIFSNFSDNRFLFIYFFKFQHCRHIHINTCAVLTGSCPWALKVMVYGHWCDDCTEDHGWQ